MWGHGAGQGRAGVVFWRMRNQDLVGQGTLAWQRPQTSPPPRLLITHSPSQRQSLSPGMSSPQPLSSKAPPVPEPSQTPAGDEMAAGIF